ncbi:hypothetical protein [Bosea sp. BIWAKO-01]|uniref:hypothetical protein n=1 Tax=Bosea sp. BIWAKO-01 TaxID=506668 RepID=UPI00159F1570|nr:hypothetical protein [Bosea sp. BIWAKO-01]
MLVVYFLRSSKQQRGIVRRLRQHRANAAMVRNPIPRFRADPVRDLEKGSIVGGEMPIEDRLVMGDAIAKRPQIVEGRMRALSAQLEALMGAMTRANRPTSPDAG